MLDLWLPIVLSAVFIFLASFVLHMVLSYHWSDYSRLPNEEALRAALRDLPPGNYNTPHADGPKDFSSPKIAAQFKEGPVALMHVWPSGPPTMGKQLSSWFVYSLLVSVVVAYVVSRTLGPDAHYLAVFRVAGTAAFLAFAGAAPIQSIWMGRSWGATFKQMIDGLIYALLTAGTFGWLAN